METEHPLLNTCILGRLFEFADVKMLKTCRSVCKTWNVVAGFHLRKRTWVRIEQTSLEEFHKTFQTPSDVSMKMIKKFHFNKYRLHRALLSVILEHRSSIESLRFRSFDNLMAHTLFALPSLEHLEIFRVSSEPPVPAWNRTGFGGNSFQKLKSCILQYGYDSSTVRSETTMENLQAFHISLLKSCEKTLETLDLRDFYIAEYMAISAQVNFQRLKNLKLDATTSCPSYWVRINEYKKLLRRYGSNLETFACSLPMSTTGQDVTDILKTLVNAREVEIHCYRGYNTHADFQVTDIPTFTHLTRLQLGRTLGPQVDVGQLASRLPNIRKLSVYLPMNESKGWTLMKHLEELEIRSKVWSGDVSRCHWDMTHEIFPNLTKLTITLTAGSGRTIFADLRNLKELICEKDSTICDEDITGIESEKLLTLQDDPDHVPRTRPYIGDLKSLRVLRLEGTAITDVSLKYGVSQLESLTHLLIQYPEERVTKIVYGERFEEDDAKGNTDQPRRIVVQEVCTQRIKASSYQLDIESLMLPKVPNLIELNVVVSPKYRKVFARDPVQAEKFQCTRPNVCYHLCESEYWPHLEMYLP